ncbi:conserved hypothetical protein [Candidatus Magnetomoraceae bacterium gMMP-15]
MSVRGWYEFYILDQKASKIALPMQFYKWGDAVPYNALIEFNHFKEILEECNNYISIAPLDIMLREQLGEAYQQLPKYFSLGCYLFFLQRAYEEELPLNQIKFYSLPKEERPDYKLGYELGKASVEQNYTFIEHHNEFIRKIHDYIAIGSLLRKWNDCSSNMDFLSWIQYLTQITKKIDMGSIVGYRSRPSDVSFTYRFFFTIPEFQLNQKIESIKIELSSSQMGNIMLSWEEDVKYIENEDEKEDYINNMKEIEDMIESNNVELFSLNDALKSYHMEKSILWD